VRATPVFGDVDPRTFNLTVEAAREKITPRTKAIMPVHLYGHPADMEGFSKLCQERGLILLEDAAQAHLASIGKRCVGTYGTASFSFYPSKNMTTGEGGMVTTEDDEIARKLRMIRNQGMNTQYVHEIVGSNFRMTNLCAAIGVPQVARLQGWTAQRQKNAGRLSENLRSVTPPLVQPGCRHVFHQYTVIAPEGSDRDAIVARLNEKGVGVRVYYPQAIHQQPIVKELGLSNVDLPVTSSLVKRVFSLPVHPFLTEEELSTIVSEVNQSC
jgi:dTDP-4-amino-4,6-dideoxygalactose transaminase